MSSWVMFAAAVGLFILSYILSEVLPSDKITPTVAVKDKSEELDTYLPDHIVKLMDEIHNEYMRTRMPPQLMKRRVVYRSPTLHPGIEEWQWEHDRPHG